MISMGALIFATLVNDKITMIAGLAVILFPILCFKLYYTIISLREWYLARKQRELSDVTISDVVNDSSIKDVSEHEKEK